MRGYELGRELSGLELLCGSDHPMRGYEAQERGTLTAKDVVRSPHEGLRVHVRCVGLLCWGLSDHPMRGYESTRQKANPQRCRRSDHPMRGYESGHNSYAQKACPGVRSPHEGLRGARMRIHEIGDCRVRSPHEGLRGQRPAAPTGRRQRSDHPMRGYEVPAAENTGFANLDLSDHPMRGYERVRAIPVGPRGWVSDHPMRGYERSSLELSAEILPARQITP